MSPRCGWTGDCPYVATYVARFVALGTSIPVCLDHARYVAWPWLSKGHPLRAGSSRPTPVLGGT